LTQEEFSGTGVLQSVYDDAIFAGVRPAEFQELTYGEIKACIRAYNRREEERAAEQRLKQKNLVSIAYRTAALVGIMTWQPKRAPTLEKAFPEWFGGDDAANTQLWKRQQAGMTAYVLAYNETLRAKNQEG